MTNKSDFVRPTLAEWSRVVELRLRANDWKGGWESCNVWELQDHLWQELRELEAVLHRIHQAGFENWDIGLATLVRDEAADVAALAMMIADVAGPVPHDGQRVNGKAQ